MSAFRPVVRILAIFLLGIGVGAVGVVFRFVPGPGLPLLGIGAVFAVLGAAGLLFLRRPARPPRPR